MNRTFSVLIIATVAMAQPWSLQSSGVSSQLDGVWFTSTMQGWAVGDAGTSLVTADGGQNWSTFSLTARDLEDVAFSGAALGLVVGDDGLIFRTTNAGANWSSVTSGTSSNLRAVALGSGNAAYAAGVDGVILRSTDAGESWSVIETGSIRWEGLWAVGDQHAWAVGRGGNIKTTADAGATWQAQTSSTGSDLHGVFFIDQQTGWAVGQNDVALKTVNGGANWSLANSGINVSLDGVHFESANEGWVVGALGRVWRTTDGGGNWLPETSPTSNELNDVFFFDQNHGWAVGMSGTTIARVSAGIEGRPVSVVPGSIRVTPNPVVRRSRISFTLTSAGRLQIRVLDASGRPVRTLVRSMATAGNGELTWDRSDDRGRQVGAGVYFYEVTFENAVRRVPVVVATGRH